MIGDIYFSCVGFGMIPLVWLDLVPSKVWLNLLL